MNENRDELIAAGGALAIIMAALKMYGQRLFDFFLMGHHERIRLLEHRISELEASRDQRVREREAAIAENVRLRVENQRLRSRLDLMYHDDNDQVEEHLS